MIKKILLWIVAAVLIMQLIPVNRTNKPVDAGKDFVQVNQTPEEIVQLLRTACYDCHSDETVYPWYAYVAPFSWSVKNHVNTGKRYLNFSVWQTYNRDQKTRMLQHSASTTENMQMPLPSYIANHPEAALTAPERKQLADYFRKVLESGVY